MRNPLAHALLSLSPILYAILEIQSNGDATAITNIKNCVVPIEKTVAVAAGNGQHSQSNVTRRNLLFM